MFKLLEKLFETSPLLYPLLLSGISGVNPWLSLGVKLLLFWGVSWTLFPNIAWLFEVNPLFISKLIFRDVLVEFWFKKISPFDWGDIWKWAYNFFPASWIKIHKTEIIPIIEVINIIIEKRVFFPIAFFISLINAFVTSSPHSNLILIVIKETKAIKLSIYRIKSINNMKIFKNKIVLSKESISQ